MTRARTPPPFPPNLERGRGFWTETIERRESRDQIDEALGKILNERDRLYQKVAELELTLGRWVNKEEEERRARQAAESEGRRLQHQLTIADSDRAMLIQAVEAWAEAHAKWKRKEATTRDVIAKEYEMRNALRDVGATDYTRG